MWSGVILIIVGAAVGSPGGGLLCMALAALCALAPIVVGPTGPRIGGVVILLIALALAAQLYPLYQKELDRMHERAIRQPSSEQMPSPVPAK